MKGKNEDEDEDEDVKERKQEREKMNRQDDGEQKRRLLADWISFTKSPVWD